VNEQKSVIARAAERAVGTASEAVSQAGEVAGRLFDARGQGRLRRLNRVPLPNLFELHPEARSAPRRELGLATIPVSTIRGTAVEGEPQRGSDFTPIPRLKSANGRARWQRLRAAQERLAVLPPIDVLQTDDGYWVVDGHNRVALALYTGQDDIDAAVTHVHLPGSHDEALKTDSLETVLADSRDLRAAAHRQIAYPATPAGEGSPTEGEGSPTEGEGSPTDK
jgi:hypothetical protein